MVDRHVPVLFYLFTCGFEETVSCSSCILDTSFAEVYI